MSDTVLKIALAGLMHDIGKFAEGGMSLSQEYTDNNQQIYQPSRDGRPSHKHALFTAAFIEHYAQHLPSVCNQPDWGEGDRLDSFINLAACHHKPETPMQWCVTQADRLSSGLDRASFTDGKPVPFTKYRSTRLLSILEGLSPDEELQDKYKFSTAYKTHYQLAPLSVADIFPTARQEISKDKAMEEYQSLFDSFLSDLGRLPHRAESTSLWAEHFDSLLATYCSQIPAARVGDVVPDVSLYDHCRTTAALAAPLYIYHKETETLNEKDINNDDPEKLLLVSGDFYGIQDFIFSAGGEQQRLRAKLLRGRSFAVSLFSELAADALCRSLNLPFTAVFLNAAGKFHLIAANTSDALQKIEVATEKLNNWLFEISFGQASLGITSTPASPAQFSQGGFLLLWDDHLKNMDTRKYQRLHENQYGVIKDFLGEFDSTLDKKLCPFCGKRPSAKEAEKDIWIDKKGSACAVCRDHIMLGANLVKGRQVALFSGEIKTAEKNRLLKPFFNTYQLRFYDHAPAIDDGPLIKFWQLGVNADGSLPIEGSRRLINGYVPVYRENDRNNAALKKILEAEDGSLDLDSLIARKDMPKTFNALAAMAKHGQRGTAALGILKADVDNLGLLISCGMDRKRFTLSRMATLSRRLDQFFSLYLPNLLASEVEFQDVYTVFAGGDDLFLIGPWNCMAPLAVRLRQEWGKYVSGNDQDKQLTFSAGITLHKTHIPVDKLAKAAEQALKQAKDNDRNSITMFGETVKWLDFINLLDKKQTMAGWVIDGIISKVMLYRFNDFIDMAGKEKKIMSDKQTVNMRDMECLKWPALLRYNLERNIKKKGQDREKAMQEVAIIKEWLQEYGSALRIPLWTQLYEQR